MKKIRTIIVDDEELARMELKRILSKLKHIEIIGEAESVKQTLEIVQKNTTHLILLDINLGNHSGFDLLEHISPSIHIIFITAYDQYAIRAFEVNALDYLLKPVNEKRLTRSINRIENIITPNTSLKLMGNDTIFINSFNCKKQICLKDISYIEAKGDYTHIYSSNGANGLVHRTMKEWNIQLPGESFLQVHRSFIVKKLEIEKIIRSNNNQQIIHLVSLNKNIPIGRSYWKSVKSEMKI